MCHRRRAGRHDHPRDARRCRQTRGEARDPTGAYTNEAVGLRLDDGDSSPIASASVGALRLWGGSGKVWQNQRAADTVLTVTIGAECVRHAATKKVD